MFTKVDHITRATGYYLSKPRAAYCVGSPWIMAFDHTCLIYVYMYVLFIVADLIFRV